MIFIIVPRIYFEKHNVKYKRTKKFDKSPEKSVCLFFVLSCRKCYSIAFSILCICQRYRILCLGEFWVFPCPFTRKRRRHWKELKFSNFSFPSFKNQKKYRNISLHTTSYLVNNHWTLIVRLQYDLFNLNMP